MSGLPGMDDLRMYVISKNPSDFPGMFVMRIWHIGKDGKAVTATAPCSTRPTLEEIRKFVPVGTINMGRHETDDPVIVETWI